ncbi:MAG: hypothetical protein WC582_05515 [Patescibacteria group bacterium]
MGNENINTGVLISLKKKEDELNYEIWMFKSTCDIFFSGVRPSLFWHNLLVESLALHVRVLIDFFYCDRKGESDDIIAQDLLPSSVSWSELRPQLPEILREAKKKTNKQLAHLSSSRIDLKKQGEKDWRILDIYNKMNDIIERFYKIKRCE